MMPKLVNKTMAEHYGTHKLTMVYTIYNSRRIHGVNLQQRINHPRDFTGIGI